MAEQCGGEDWVQSRLLGEAGSGGEQVAVCATRSEWRRLRPDAASRRLCSSVWPDVVDGHCQWQGDGGRGTPREKHLSPTAIPWAQLGFGVARS